MNTVPVKAYNGLSVQDLRKQLLEETDAASVRNIVNQINSHLQKKDILRKTQMSDLQDDILNQIEQRVHEKGDCFSNKDLIDYFRTMEDSVNRIDSTAEVINPQIKIHQPITINMDKPSLSREEKMQVLNAVKSIIDKVQNEQLQKSSEVVEGEYKELNDDNR